MQQRVPSKASTSGGVTNTLDDPALGQGQSVLRGRGLRECRQGAGRGAGVFAFGEDAVTVALPARVDSACSREISPARLTPSMKSPRAAACSRRMHSSALRRRSFGRGTSKIARSFERSRAGQCRIRRGAVAHGRGPGAEARLRGAPSRFGRATWRNRATRRAGSRSRSAWPTRCSKIIPTRLGPNGRRSWPARESSRRRLRPP